MDSRIKTYEHIREIQTILMKAIGLLQQRLLKHDASKLESPEVEVFDEFTPKLAASTYLSTEYEEFRRAMKPALDHHYATNPHHPEHYPNGVKDMTLVDLMEMLSDWMASSRRHNNGNILTSIQKNQDRFGYGDELKQILLNTVKLLESSGV